MPVDLEAIRKRLRAASAGPWKVSDNGIGELYAWNGVDGNKNAEFVAHAPQDIRDLLALVEELQEYHSRYSGVFWELMNAIWQARHDAEDRVEELEDPYPYDTYGL